MWEKKMGNRSYYQHIRGFCCAVINYDCHHHFTIDPRTVPQFSLGEVINTLAQTNAAQSLPFVVPYKLIVAFTPLQKKYSYISPLSWLNLANVTTRVQGMYTLPSFQYICATFIIFSIILSFIIVGRVRKMLLKYLKIKKFILCDRVYEMDNGVLSNIEL